MNCVEPSSGAVFEVPPLPTPHPQNPAIMRRAKRTKPMVFKWRCNMGIDEARVIPKEVKFEGKKASYFNGIGGEIPALGRPVQINVPGPPIYRQNGSLLGVGDGFVGVVDLRGPRLYRPQNFFKPASACLLRESFGDPIDGELHVVNHQRAVLIRGQFPIAKTRSGLRL